MLSCRHSDFDPISRGHAALLFESQEREYGGELIAAEA
jgi:hypothetical protein